MLTFLGRQRVQKAAVSTIAPFVEGSRRRLAGIPDGAWLEPYMVGFLSMLITLIVEKAGRLETTDALGLAQATAWERITGLRSHLIGDEIALLSAIDDPEFVAGCRNAAEFHAAVCRDEAVRQRAALWQDPLAGRPGDTGWSAETSGGLAPADQTSWALWERHFEDHLRH